MGKRDVPTKRFQVTSLSVEQDGKPLLARAPSDPPLEAKPRNRNDVDTAMIVWVPLDDLKWVDGSKLTVVAEVLVHGAAAPVVVEQEFQSTIEERTYTACERFQML